MRILVVGKGAREHALGMVLARSRNVERIWFAPGNAGTELLGTHLPLQPTDVEGILAAAREHHIDLVVIGPEAPLAAGLADRLREGGIPVIGPGQQAAFLEGSKVWAKSFMERHKIPTASARAFSSVKVAREYLKRTTFPAVVKADGLAEGKGVAIVRDIPEAELVLDRFMTRAELGEAGKRLLIEEHLEGEEYSIFFLLDGTKGIPFGAARDYKRALDGDEGNNTGGMGGVAAADLLSGEEWGRIQREIALPTIEGLSAEGLLYRGILFIGIMMTKNGPRVLEYNVRLGDPETEVLLPLLEEDPAELFLAAASGALPERPLRWNDRAACGVVVAREGYPGRYGVDHLVPIPSAAPDLLVFHASTARKGGAVVNQGGRTLVVVGLADTVAEARRRAYAALEPLDLSGYHYRRDIGRVAGAAAGVPR